MNANDTNIIVATIKIIKLIGLKLIIKWTGIQQANPLGTIVKNIILTALPNITSGYKLEFNKADVTNELMSRDDLLSAFVTCKKDNESVL